MFDSDFIDKFFGKNGIGSMFKSMLNDYSLEEELNETKKDGEYSEETYEKDGKTVKVETWKGKDGSFYSSKTVIYGTGLPKKEEKDDLPKLEAKLEKAIKNQEFEKCAELRDEINKLKEKEGS
jgi:excinuclease UvrABC helicase subunit UvrB